MPYTPFRLVLFIIAVCALMAQPVFADDNPLFKAGEGPTPGEIRPSAALVRVVLGAIDKDDIEQLDGCLAEHEFKRADYASLLLAVKIDAGAGRTLWFVRPAHEPFCLALYGAHSFRYFWIEERPSGARPRFRIRFHSGGDYFAVYPQQSHGLNDIEETNCIATACISERMSFDGQKYQTVRCTRTTYEDGRKVKEEERCGFDGGRDDQPSGLVPPSGK